MFGRGGRLTNAMTSKCNIDFSFVTGQKKQQRSPYILLLIHGKNKLKKVTRDSNLI